ncbi:hypothetical protein MBLNU459_g0549t1 [Dothideomycetes sp. NU459]
MAGRLLEPAGGYRTATMSCSKEAKASGDFARENTEGGAFAERLPGKRSNKARANFSKEPANFHQTIGKLCQMETQAGRWSGPEVKGRGGPEYRAAWVKIPAKGESEGPKEKGANI